MSCINDVDRAIFYATEMRLFYDWMSYVRKHALRSSKLHADTEAALRNLEKSRDAFELSLGDEYQNARWNLEYATGVYDDKKGGE